MGWVASHISGRSAYEFNNEYQQIPSNSTLNWTGNHSIGITLKPKAGQVDYALMHKGEPTNNPETNSIDNTLYMAVRNGYLYLWIFFGSQVFYVRTVNQVMQTSNVTSIEYTWNDVTNELLIYIDAVSVPYQIIYVGGYSYNLPADIGSNVLVNSNTTEFTFGKSLNDPQFEGIIYDTYLYKKTRSGAEVFATYTVVKDPSITSGGEKIIFGSTRLTSGYYNLWIGNNKLENVTPYKASLNALIEPSYLYSTNGAINGTKVSWVEAGVGIIVANRDGSNPIIIPRNNSVDSVQLAFKTDGTEVYFIAYNTGTSTFAIFKGDFNLTTNAVTNITIVKADAGYNYLSIDIKPNNTKLATRRVAVSNDDEFITLMNLDGSSETILQSFASSEDIFRLKFNKQGTKIGFSRLFGLRYKIFIMSDIGGSLQQIEGDNGSAYFHCFSPDGNNLIYSLGSNPWGYSSIFKMGIDGRNKINLSNYNGYNDLYAEWLPS